LNVEEMVIIQHLLVEKSIAKYGGTEYDYSQSDPMLHYDDDPDRWEQDKHRWEGYLTGFRPPTIVYHDSLYGINGLGSGIRSHVLEKTINVQLLDMTEQEYLARNPEDKFIEITEKEMDMMPAVKNAISQIGTWEKSIKESQYTGDKIQQETLSYFQFETADQLPDFDDGYIVDFTYNGNYYRTGYAVC